MKVLSYLFLALKGFLFGIANDIPGVSGGSIAVITGIYEKLINSINNIFKKFKESFIFLLIFGIGVVLGILFGAKVIVLCTDNFPIPTSLFFVGLILGGMPLIVKNMPKSIGWKTILAFILAICVVVGFMFIPTKEITTVSGIDYLILFLCGFVAIIAMIIPGMSGSMLMKVFGYYDLIMKSISNITHLGDNYFNTLFESIKVLAPLGIGIVIGLFSICKLISFLMKRFPNISLWAIVGFVLASVGCLIYLTFDGTYGYDITQIIIGIIMIPIGFVLTFFLSIISNKKENPNEIEEAKLSAEEVENES